MPQSTSNPSRGEIWLVDLNPVRGHEQAGSRPCLILSVNEFNHGPADMVVIAPFTKTQRPIPFHVPVSPNETGLDHESMILCDQIRSVSKTRLVRPIGPVV